MKTRSLLILAATSLCLLASCGGNNPSTSGSNPSRESGTTTSSKKDEKLDYFEMVLPEKIKISFNDTGSYLIKLGNKYLKADSLNYNFYVDKGDGNFARYHTKIDEISWANRGDRRFDQVAPFATGNLYPNKSDNGYYKDDTFSYDISGVTYTGYNYINGLDSFSYVNEPDFKFVIHRYLTDPLGEVQEFKVTAFDTSVTEFPVEVPQE